MEGLSSECLRSLLSLLPRLLMRKKFLIRCETWLFDPLTCLFDDRGRPENVLFSAKAELFDDDELNNWVMAVNEQCYRKNLYSLLQVHGLKCSVKGLDW